MSWLMAKLSLRLYLIAAVLSTSFLYTCTLNKFVRDLLAVLSAWDKCEKVEAGILVAGDFNCADEKYP